MQYSVHAANVTFSAEQVWGRGMWESWLLVWCAVLRAAGLLAVVFEGTLVCHLFGGKLWL